MNDVRVKIVLILTIGFIIGIALIGYFRIKAKQPGQLDTFTQCLESSGTLFYGAFWCSHCQDQKDLFDSSARYLPYVECSSLDSQSQLPICEQNNITSYPTWTFRDGSRVAGVLQLEELSQRSGCQLTR